MQRHFRYCYWLLGLLAACRAAGPAGPPAATVLPTPAVRPWFATIAERLYERQILSAAGRDSLQRRIDGRALQATYRVPGREAYYVDTLTDPATVLAFCGELFRQELLYRLDFGRGLAQLSDSGDTRLRQRFAAALRDTHGDTAAATRQLASPPQRIEDHIRAEDSLSRTGWTIYPPLSALPATASAPGIAESRSVMGRTRTRTARDYYELGLVSGPQYAILRRELAAGRLDDEVRLTLRAAELALDAASYPARRLAYDSLLDRLALAGVLPPAGRQQLLADSLALRSMALFEVLPYCAHARVVSLDSLPAAPRLLYPRLLAAAASAAGPAFRYAALRVQLREHRRYNLREQLITLSFEAGGRHYATTFAQGFESDAPDRADAPPRPALRYVPDELAALLNQYLRDQGGPARLYLATPEDNPALEDARVGWVLLTSAQRAAWGTAPQWLDGPPSPDTLFTSARIERALALYQRLGLLAKLPATKLAQGREQALGGTVASYAGVLACFPGLVVDTGGEDAEEPQAYARALRQVAAATRGAFRPTRIHDTFRGEVGRNQRSILSFASKGRVYRAALTSDLGWMINDFMALVQRAVRETTNGQLYYLGYGDETGLYLFLTAAQAAALRQIQPTLFREHDAEVARSQQR